MRHIFLVGAKSFGTYGGYETFIDKLTEYHAHEGGIKYHVAVKANGQGASIPNGAIKKKGGFDYHNADCFQIAIPEWMESAQAIYYDYAALKKSISIIKEQKMDTPIVYIMTCRIGPFFNYYVKQIKRLNGKVFLNPDGHEWMRSKWPVLIRKYWKYNERVMVKYSDLIVCDSVNIENYIRHTYGVTNTIYLSYGAETKRSECSDDEFEEWLNDNMLRRDEYYLIVGRFVPENNYETMIREYMKSHTKKALAIITNKDTKFSLELESKLNFSRDTRVKFIGAVYDKQLLKKIRENAYGYIHGHEVGGTNPSLLEALGSTKLNLLLKVGFNEEVAEDAAVYWTKAEGELSFLIDRSEEMDREDIGRRAKKRIESAYSWELVGKKYLDIWK